MSRLFSKKAVPSRVSSQTEQPSMPALNVAGYPRVSQLHVFAEDFSLLVRSLRLRTVRERKDILN